MPIQDWNEIGRKLAEELIAEYGAARAPNMLRALIGLAHRAGMGADAVTVDKLFAEIYRQDEVGQVAPRPDIAPQREATHPGQDIAPQREAIHQIRNPKSEIAPPPPPVLTVQTGEFGPPAAVSVLQAALKEAKKRAKWEKS